MQFVHVMNGVCAAASEIHTEYIRMVRMHEHVVVIIIFSFIENLVHSDYLPLKVFNIQSAGVDKI